MWKHYGYGWKKLYGERQSVAFELLDPQTADWKVVVPAYSGGQDEAATGMFSPGRMFSPKSKKQEKVDFLADVVVTHISPFIFMNYDVPTIINGELQATKNLIRGAPMCFGMMDGTGQGERADIPEHLEQLLQRCGIGRERVNYRGQKVIRQLVICETTIRINDQVNLVARFENDPSNPKILHAKAVCLPVPLLSV